MTTVEQMMVFAVHHNGDTKYFEYGLDYLIYKQQCQLEDYNQLIKEFDIPTDDLYTVTINKKIPGIGKKLICTMYKGKLIFYQYFNDIAEQMDANREVSCTEWNANLSMKMSYFSEHIFDIMSILNGEFNIETCNDEGQSLHYSWGTKYDGIHAFMTRFESASKEDIIIHKIKY